MVFPFYFLSPKVGIAKESFPLLQFIMAASTDKRVCVCVRAESDKRVCVCVCVCVCARTESDPVNSTSQCMAHRPAAPTSSVRKLGMQNH